jgi:hypothetical protein
MSPMKIPAIAMIQKRIPSEKRERRKKYKVLSRKEMKVATNSTRTEDLPPITLMELSANTTHVYRPEHNNGLSVAISSLIRDAIMIIFIISATHYQTGAGRFL